MIKVCGMLSRSPHGAKGATTNMTRRLARGAWPIVAFTLMGVKNIRSWVSSLDHRRRQAPGGYAILTRFTQTGSTGHPSDYHKLG